MKNNENGVSSNGIGSSESLHRSGHFGKQYSENNDNLVSSSIQPFNNNPSLPSTQRYNDIFLVISIEIVFFFTLEILLVIIFNLIPHTRMIGWMMKTIN